ncbi:hypothetical protein [Alkalicoccus halolimnae]|uniref:Family 2 glycosyl transferase n=1 Tax=Alkalicoccus halolimnae TaxID=1667239 RepID=A0AAJ8LYU7_9BACI|nr:hypothetical protein [Alkalicoccus halolimnae]
MKKLSFIIIIIIASAGAAFTWLMSSGSFGKAEIYQTEEDGLSYNSRIQGDEWEVYTENGWETIPLKGVNLGMAKPATFPGDAGISREEYRRWFEQIGEMNANSIRNYTLQPPEFYEEFLAYNEQAEEPLYLYHGVWIEEIPLEETLDAFTPEITETFQAEMKRVADAVHGNAEVEEKPGHAHGSYTADISPYVNGWILGIEWHPEMVDNMLNKYPDLGEYEGDYIYTENAAPMEYWLAEQFDTLFAYEKETYSTMRPLSFTNWVTTDNLDQPAEPSDQEDTATVDPNHIHLKNEAEHVGTFASYHVYPYYPDFLNLEEDYLTFEDHLGNPSNYAGYLHDLHESHDIPVLIAEFGIPASRGKTHSNPFGWDQGFISEQEQGDIVSYLFDVIMEEDMLGGFIFTWQDEWFKRTWNTMEYDNPDRRPFWSNAQTNEQQFGLLSFDRHKIRINGEDDWTDETVLHEGDSPLQSISAEHDERYLYLKAEGEFEAGDTLDFYLSVRPDQGVDVDGFPADFQLSLQESEGRMTVAGDYDTFFYDYAERLDMLETVQQDFDEKEDVFHPIRLALNKEMVRPDTGETLPFEYYETGVFQEGIADPEHDAYDSLNDYVFHEENNLIEVRIPWMLLNAKDPSQKEFMGSLWTEGLEDSLMIEGIGVTAELTRSGEPAASFPSPASYIWEAWDLPEYEERLKQSYDDIQEVFSTYN